jgi:sulfate/thiosulfate-binding protein
MSSTRDPEHEWAPTSLSARPPAPRPRQAPWLNLLAIAGVLVSGVLVVSKNLARLHATHALVNVSYDPTRELYQDVNRAFSAKYQRRGERAPTIEQSHGGSGRQARAVIDGAPADVVSLAMFTDVDSLRKRGLVAEGWTNRLPNGSVPYTSTIVFVVRQGNPRHIADFPDLVSRDVTLVTPDPKTSGNGKLSFLAAWGSVLHAGGTDADARAFVTRLYQHVVALDSGARGAALTFAQEKVGDVHLTWENEALREVDESKGELEVVYPKASLRAEPYVAWVDANVRKHHTEALAKAYLSFLFTPAGQELIALHGYRPFDDAVLARHHDLFPPITLFSVNDFTKGWDDADQRFFADNGVFDAIYSRRRDG